MGDDVDWESVLDMIDGGITKILCWEGVVCIVYSFIPGYFD